MNMHTGFYWLLMNRAFQVFFLFFFGVAWHRFVSASSSSSSSLSSLGGWRSFPAPKKNSACTAKKNIWKTYCTFENLWNCWPNIHEVYWCLSKPHYFDLDSCCVPRTTMDDLWFSKNKELVWNSSTPTVEACWFRSRIESDLRLWQMVGATWKLGGAKNPQLTAMAYCTLSSDFPMKNLTDADYWKRFLCTPTAFPFQISPDSSTVCLPLLDRVHRWL